MFTALYVSSNKVDWWQTCQVSQLCSVSCHFTTYFMLSGFDNWFLQLSQKVTLKKNLLSISRIHFPTGSPLTRKFGTSHNVFQLLLLFPALGSESQDFASWGLANQYHLFISVNNLWLIMLVTCYELDDGYQRMYPVWFDFYENSAT